MPARKAVRSVQDGGNFGNIAPARRPGIDSDPFEHIALRVAAADGAHMRARRDFQLGKGSA